MTDVVFNIFSSEYPRAWFSIDSSRHHALQFGSTGFSTLARHVGSFDVLIRSYSLVIFPILGSVFRIWWLDSLGGLLLSIYVIVNWYV